MRKRFEARSPPSCAACRPDSRIFARIVPKGYAGFEGGEWLSRPFQDPFLFSDREVALTHVREEFEQVALPHDITLKAEMFDPGQARSEHESELRQVRLEQEAFRRLLDAEDARVERERTLPKGAGDLVRAVTLGWPMSPRQGSMHDLESMLAWRLANVEQSLSPSSISEAERDDLRDVLAQLAPRVAPLPHAAAAMAKLRAVLDTMWVTPFATEDEATIDHELELYVGSPLAFDALDSAFAKAQRTFDGQVAAGFSVLDERAQARVVARAKAILFAAPACAPRTPVRTPFDMAPPDERAWACSLVHSLDEARTDEEEIAADLAWHDAIVTARWAVSTHGPVRSPDVALRLAQPREPLSRAERDRLFVLARARPLRAMAAGVAAVVLSKTGGAFARARATRWRAIGDAPLDVVDELLTTRRPTE